MTNQQSITQFFKGVSADLAADQVAKGIKASGASIESLKAEPSPDGGQLKGSAYFYQQIYGRRPGVMPPVENILEWIRVKGIQSDIKPESLAWAISKKIAQSGTDIFRRKREGLEFSGIVAKHKDDLVKNLIKGTMAEIKNAIQK